MSRSWMYGLNDEGHDWSTSQSVYLNVYPSVYRVSVYEVAVYELELDVWIE